MRAFGVGFVVGVLLHRVVGFVLLSLLTVTVAELELDS